MPYAQDDTAKKREANADAESRAASLKMTAWGGGRIISSPTVIKNVTAKEGEEFYQKAIKNKKADPNKICFSIAKP